ncbi:MAG: hypothetical protein KGH74_03590 [Candidatus Micrarchaeota archaeon]|nr:hypothetical protein [Candidatus Micrarchaeota archaeon]
MPEYEQRTVIVKHKKDEGKIKRWIINPVERVAGIGGKDHKAKRVEA